MLKILVHKLYLYLQCRAFSYACVHKYIHKPICSIDFSPTNSLQCLHKIDVNEILICIHALRCCPRENTVIPCSVIQVRLLFTVIFIWHLEQIKCFTKSTSCTFVFSTISRLWPRKFLILET